MNDTPSSTPSLASHNRVLAGRYRLHEKLAAGGMAEVWEATDDVLARRVAVKLLHRHLAADASFVERFRREAVAAARLSHPAIVSIFDTCSDGGDEAIVMELVKGDTLRDELATSGPIEPRRAVDIVAQVSDALAFAHRAGVVHRDVKPGNILMCDDGRVLVTDFGIAKAVTALGHAAGEDSSDLTATGAVIGTAKYLAPEQVQGGPVDGRTDVYALGVVLYELLCGRPPFVADTDLATAVLRLSSEPPRPRHVRPGIPRPLEAIVMKAMARDPDDRYATADDLRSALLAVDLGADDVTSLSAARSDATSVATAPARHDAGPTFTESERTWLVPAFLVCLIAVALGVAGILLGRTEVGQDLIQRGREAVGVEPAAEPVAIAGVRTFDPPPGDGREHDDEVLLAVDGDPSTAWTTERYRVRQLTRLKPGVGFVVELGQATSLEELTVSSPTNGWAATIYVAERPVTPLEAWGSPVVERSGIAAGDADFDLGGARGGAILIWITDVGDGPLPAAAEISNVTVTG